MQFPVLEVALPSGFPTPSPVRRNRTPGGDYHAGLAHARASQKVKRPRELKLNDTMLCAAIERWMDDGWIPKLIAAGLEPDPRREYEPELIDRYLEAMRW